MLYFYLVVNHVDRMQRFMTLGDTDFLDGARFKMSVNTSFLDALADYPLGAGLASAFGTSIPYFLMAGARPQIGIENEYGQIVIEQGIPGLVIWLGFIGACVFRKTYQMPGSPTAMRYLHAFVTMIWCVAPFGVGLLAGIPGGALVLLMMGIRFGSPVQERAAKALRHVGQPRRNPAVSPPIPAAARVPTTARLLS